MNIYIAYEINLWPFRRDDDFTLKNALFGTVKLVKNALFGTVKLVKNALFGTVKLVKNADKDKYKYSGYGKGLDNY